MASYKTAIQVVSISTALVASGGIATLSLFDIPELRSQPASRALPSTRWLFSRGSHIFPTGSFISSAGFGYLAYQALPTRSTFTLQLLRHGKVPGYFLAAILTFSIGPFTSIVMVPTNFKLIKMNEDHGGARSEKSAQLAVSDINQKIAEVSVDVNDEVPKFNDKGSQFTDTSGPQQKTPKDTSQAEDEEVRKLLGKFGRLNGVRAILMAIGGVVGLSTALL